MELRVGGYLGRLSDPILDKQSRTRFSSKRQSSYDPATAAPAIGASMSIVVIARSRFAHVLLLVGNDLPLNTLGERPLQDSANGRARFLIELSRLVSWDRLLRR